MHILPGSHSSSVAAVPALELPQVPVDGHDLDDAQRRARVAMTPNERMCASLQMVVHLALALSSKICLLLGRGLFLRPHAGNLRNVSLGFLSVRLSPDDVASGIVATSSHHTMNGVEDLQLTCDL